MIGEKGRRIRELKSLILLRFTDLVSNKLELFAERIGIRGLCAVAQAESLRYKLIGGLVVRRLFLLLHVFFLHVFHVD